MRVDRTVLVTLFLTFCLAASEVRAQALKSGEFRINQSIAGLQWLPDVAIAANGRFVVVWQEGRDALDYTTPVSIKARIFDAAGKARSGEILVDRHKRPTYPGHAVAIAPDGRFVVVWGGGKENPYLVFGRRFAADGRALDSRFPLAQNTDYQSSPDVAMAADGSFVTVWAQAVEPQDPTDHEEYAVDVLFRRFAADGRPFGPEALAIGGYEEQSGPRVALRPDGGFVVACEDYNGVDYDIAARPFAHSGAPLGDAFQVNDGPHPEGSQDNPSLAVAADGRFAIAWTDRAGDKKPPFQGLESSVGVAIRFYAADGSPLGPERAVNVFQYGMQAYAEVSALQTGGFLMLWESGAGQDGDEFGIFGRVFGAAGELRGQEFRVNLNRTGSQRYPALSVAPNGKGTAVWFGPDGDNGGIFARLIAPPQSR